MHEKKGKVKDEEYYVNKLEEVNKKKNPPITKPAFVVQQSDDGMIEVWSSDSEDDEVRRPTHGRCLMVQNDTCSDSCFATKPLSEQVKETENVIDKVHSILKFLNICPSTYDSELNDLRYTVSSLSDSLTRTRLSYSNLDEKMHRILFKNEERRIKIEVLELELSRSKDDVIYLTRDNLGLLKHRNIFCLFAKRLYANITQLYLDCDICKNLHHMILPFLELNEDEIDVDGYKYESIVSSDESFDSYRIRLEKIETFIKSKENKNMIQTILNDSDKEQIKTDSITMLNSMSKKLSSEEALKIENDSEFHESEMSEISVEDVIDCSICSQEKEISTNKLI